MNKIIENEENNSLTSNSVNINENKIENIKIVKKNRSTKNVVNL